MRRWMQVLLSAPLLASLPSSGFPDRGAGPVPTTIVNPVMTLSPGFALPSAYWRFPATGREPEFPSIGQHLLIVGMVSEFQAPFDDLSAADPGVEYTYRMRDMTVTGTSIWDDFFRNEGGIGVEHSGGILEIYRDLDPDADFKDPATFADGELILSATISQFLLVLYSSQIPSQTASLQFTGGTLFNRVSQNGQGLPGTDIGDFSMNPDLIPGDLLLEGYNAVSRTSISVTTGVPVRPVTWGAIKAGGGSIR